MSRKKAEFLTGYAIRAIHGPPGSVHLGAFDGCDLVAEVEDANELAALRRLVRFVYRLHCRQVLVAGGWRCAHCRRSRPLDVHHKRPRSLGGTHRRDNLEPVCWDCHRRIHTHRMAARQGLGGSQAPQRRHSGGEDGF